MLRRMTAAVMTLVSMVALMAALAAPASASDQWTCFGYTGTFADLRSDGRATEMVYHWSVDPDNCVGISPGRQIWVASVGHPWATIPGDGRADAVWAGWESYANGVRVRGFRVWVAASDTYYCQRWWDGAGWDGYWWACSG